MYWFLLKLAILALVPLPVNAKITRPDPTKNEWTFTCDEFKSAWQLVKILCEKPKPMTNVQTADPPAKERSD